MRIEYIRLKNLNSLVGEWEIDLQDNAYGADGIFSITGPTGVGKSTILDAICLALYGCTPRLGRISKGGNEIMSRQTGECYAEIRFSIGGRRFCCSWSQRRARKKADGELQTPKHEIADLDQNVVMETKLLAVSEQVEAVTGLNFDRFTRSMLLAQGRFAAFLQSSADERAPILEQITGTEMYSRISIKVHERRSNEQKKLESLRANMDGLQLLSAEDEQHLEALLQESLHRDTALKLQVERQNELIAWTNRIATLKNELDEITGQQKNLQARLSDFAPLKEKQRRAELAMELSGQHATLSQIRQQVADERQRQEEGQKRLHTCQALVQQAKAHALEEEAKHAQAKTAHEQALPLIRQARALDLRIEEKSLPVLAAEKALNTRQQNLNELKKQQERSTTHYHDVQKQLNQLNGQIDKHQQDATLPEQAVVLSMEIQALNKILAEQQNKKNAVALQKKQQSDVDAKWQEMNNALQKLKEISADKQKELDSAEKHYQKYLAGRPLSAWQEDRLSLTQTKDRLRQIQKIIQEMQELRKNSTDLQNNQDLYQKQKQHLSAQLATYQQQEETLEQEAAYLEEKLLHLQKIVDLEDARQHLLHDGAPCPLCGAMEHPFAGSGAPVPDGEKERLHYVRGELKNLRQKISRMEMQKANAEKDLEHAAASQKNADTQIAIKQTQLDNECAAFPLFEPSAANLGANLAQLGGDVQKKLETAEQVINFTEQLEKQIKKLRVEVDKNKDNLIVRNQQTQQIFLDKHKTEETLARVQDEYRALDAEQKMICTELQKKLSLYAINISPNTSPEQLNTIDALLYQRRDQWLSWQQRKEQLEQEIKESHLHLAHQTALLEKEKEALQQQSDTLTTLQQKRDILITERKQCFGNQNPDQREQQLLQMITKSEQDRQKARQIMESAIKEESQQKAILADVEQSITQKTTLANSAEQDFLCHCQQLDFANEAEYQRACLPEEERKALSAQAQSLEREQIELQIQADTKERLLHEEQQRNLSEKPLPLLQQEQTEFLSAQRENQQNTGAFRQKLADNIQQKEQSQKYLQAISIQEQECGRWDLLHKLIGSGDGKKFRNFAQSLTFERMITLANQQLQKMSDRYLLIRDTTQTLELNVVDSYQAGEIRSAKNLSGGESFIISLALALGLSRMVGRRLRMDSLFLDEGFGTLDEESMDIALGALASLRLDGKLIGIISHVPALRDRIAAQIHVRPGKGGRSILVGPGCGRTDRENKTAIASKK